MAVGDAKGGPARRAILALIGCAWAGLAAAADAPLPMVDKDTHMGVFSCSGSTCHGAVQPWPNANILQNEYVTWQRRDKHAKAYDVLLNEQSRRIARNLGLRDANSAPECLNCHADNVSADRRHPTFQLTDGVSCEACHGGAGRWIGTHIVANASHANNIQSGLFPTDDPASRARLCLSCHQGDGTRSITHRIMAAGHPRLSFELDTFTDIQPAHFKVDDDYRKRKSTYSGVQVWAIGQIVAMNNLLDGLADPKRGRAGLFPELVLFDCHGCHRPMSNPKWEARSTVGLDPGLPRVNNSNILMLLVIARHTDPALANSLTGRLKALHKAAESGFDAMAAQARQLRQTTDRLIEAFAQKKFGRDDYRAMLKGLTAFGREYTDYPGAEQAAMGLGAVMNAARIEGAITDEQYKNLDQAYKAVMSTVDKDESYSHKSFVAALNTFSSRIP